MGGQLDGNFLPGSLPHKFILIVTSIICFVMNKFLSLSVSSGEWLGCCGRVHGYSISNYFGPGRGRVWLHGLSCYGNESSLVNCSHSGWGQSAYHCSHSYDVSISCSNTTVIGKNCRRGNTVLLRGRFLDLV